MKKLKVNFDEIQKAMEDVSRDTFDYFLDLETGEVITFSEEILDVIKSRLYISDSEEFGDDVEYIEFDEEPDIPDWMQDEVDLALEIFLGEDELYERISERGSLKAYKSMADFIETVENPFVKEGLLNALNGKGAFRRFKDVLIDYPKERKRWHGYNAKAMKREIIEWLGSIGVESIS
ncbi:MAG: hypothetical protein A2Y66_03985 [Nitrospirae bacterium RBG_13_41_22]|nr:MAG: hypothetical protein A2Y66_03985 [Nitrospirae bacterium RBG_13_41_22]